MTIQILKPSDIPLTDKAKKELEDLKKELGLDKLMEDEEERTNNLPKMKMYCLSCGRLINDNYHGEMYDSTCFCLANSLPSKKYIKLLGTPKMQELQKHKATAKCVEIMEGPNKGKYDMLLSYSMMGDLSFENCKECKTKEEHKRKTVEGYLGIKWKEIKIDNPNIFLMQTEFEEAIHHRVDTDNEKNKLPC